LKRNRDKKVIVKIRMKWKGVEEYDNRYNATIFASVFRLLSVDGLCG